MTARQAAQDGMALIEALVSSAVLGVGMMGAVQLASHGLQTATDIRQRMVAHDWALDAMDCHQSMRAACAMNDQSTLQGHAYTRKIELTPKGDQGLVDITVTVQWAGAARAGTAGNNNALVLRSSRASVPVWVGVSLP
ncbi:MAG: type IV pilus modification PilV family protein [Limnohabitans sp.]